MNYPARFFFCLLALNGWMLARQGGEPQLAAHFEKTSRTMHEAMVRSYAVNRDQPWIPARSLSSVNRLLEEAQRQVEKGIRLAHRRGNRDYATTFLALRDHLQGVRSLNAGQFFSARRHLGEAAARLPWEHDPSLAALIRNALAYALLYTEGPQAALETLEEVVSRAEATGDSLAGMYRYNLAWLHLHGGDPASAVDHFLKAADWSRERGRFLWEAMARLNAGIALLLQGRAVEAREQFRKAEEGARQAGSGWYAEAAAYYRNLYSLPPASPARTLSQTAPPPQKVLTLMASSLTLLQVPGSTEKPERGVQFRVGRQSAGRGTLAVVPFYLTAAPGIRVGRLQVDLRFDQDQLQFVETDESLPQRVLTRTSSNRERVQLRFQPKGEQALPEGLLGFLIFQVAPDAHPGELPLEVTGKAWPPGSSPKEISPFEGVPGEIRILPPEACYMYNHPPVRPPGNSEHPRH